MDEKLLLSLKKNSNGPIKFGFLSRSVGSLVKDEPIRVKNSDSIASVLTTLRTIKTGAVLVVDVSGSLVGIFSERDCVLKVFSISDSARSTQSIETVMTPNPVTVQPQDSLSFALNLMSHGGFRHLPIVAEGEILGLLSVKDIVDELVGGMTTEVL